MVGLTFWPFFFPFYKDAFYMPTLEMQDLDMFAILLCDKFISTISPKLFFDEEDLKLGESGEARWRVRNNHSCLFCCSDI